MNSTQLWLAAPAQIDGVWPFVGPEIEKAVARSSLMDGGYVRERLLSSEWQLWLACVPGNTPDVRGIAVTTVDQKPKGRVCTVMVCTGKGMREWVHHLATIEQWAREVWGCVRITAWARPGWERVLKDYRKTHVVLDKDLGNAE